MVERRSWWRWLLFINAACVKSVVDVQHYVRQGTVDTWFHGWQPIADHPVAAVVNVLFDAGSVIGMCFAIGESIAQWRSTRQAQG